MSGDMSSKQQQNDATRQWIAGLIVIVATVVSFVGFARISVGWTLAISTLVLIGLVVFLWAAGGGKKT